VSALCGGKIAYRCCYKLAAVIYRKTQNEAINKRIKKKRDGNK